MVSRTVNSVESRRGYASHNRKQTDRRDLTTIATFARAFVGI